MYNQNGNRLANKTEIKKQELIKDNEGHIILKKEMVVEEEVTLEELNFQKKNLELDIEQFGKLIETRQKQLKDVESNIKKIKKLTEDTSE